MTDDTGLTKVHHSQCLEFCFRVMAAFVHIFCFFNLLEGHTRLRCFVYYLFVYLQNAVLILTWNILASTLGHGGWYATPAVAMVLGGFFLGILFEITYYLWCHPNKWSRLHRHNRIQLWVPCSELSLFNEVVVTRGADQKPVFGAESERRRGPGLWEKPQSDLGGTAVSSSVGPIIPMETSTPAQSTVGVSPPCKPSPGPNSAQPVSKPPEVTTANASLVASSTDGRALPTEATPNAQVHQADPEKPVPALRQARSPVDEVSQSKPTTPARMLEIRGQFEPKTPEPREGDKFETVV